MSWRAGRGPALAGAAALACLPALGQQAAPKPKPGAPAARTAPQPAQKAAPGSYERYQASQRLRLRREQCMRDEDLVRQYCVKRCERGFTNTTGETLPRICRGVKPLPPGSLAPALRKQTGQKPKPPAKATTKPGA